MADVKVSELTAITSVSGDDLLLVVNDPLGTPASRKVTIKNFFSSVSEDAVFEENVQIGTITDVEAEIKTKSTWSGLIGTNTAIRTLVNDRMQVANTNLLVNDRMQVANTTLLVNDRMQVANTTLLVNDRMQVGNIAVSVTTTDVIANTITIGANTGLVLAGGGIEDAIPLSSNAQNESIAAGTIWYSNNHLYIATDDLSIKRVALEDF